MNAHDADWADVARSTREALALLGHPIDSRCLPDEPDPCGGTFALHAVAHFGVITAVIEHQLAHLGGNDPASPYHAAFDEIRSHTTAELVAGCPATRPPRRAPAPGRGARA